MKSSWAREIGAVLSKEWRTEQRTRSAAYTSFVLSLATVFTLAFAFFGRTVGGDEAAGMLWAALLFAGVATLIRAFVAEDEGGTGDLLRMWARPHAVFWGKALFGFAQMTVTTALSTILFVVLTSVGVRDYALLCVGLLGGSAALAGVVTIMSSVISRGANRGTLGGVISLPMLLPLLALGVAVGRAALLPAVIRGGVVPPTPPGGWQACAGIWLYTALVFAVAPHLFAAMWRES